jgi:hypothetical protein
MGLGWAGRRALSAMIRQRAFESLGEVLGLIARLDSPVQQLWCLADLLEYWELDASGRQAVLAAAPTAAGRRRLQRRLQRL